MLIVELNAGSRKLGLCRRMLPRSFLTFVLGFVMEWQIGLLKLLIRVKSMLTWYTLYLIGL